ncbi:MAG: hypothetical protein KGI54_10580 [Pseudomonadota bacterium]|nr:hypothetical protein [Pseudomonadota bacterium]
MCGIVGIIPKFKGGLVKQQEDSFLQLLYVDALRGEDSTGVIGVENDSSFHIAKGAVEAARFLPQLDMSALSKRMWHSGKAYIGHNRKKTIGALSDENAHPFVVKGEFAMVHNGTLHSHKHLADTTVDSEALAIHLAKAFGKKDYTKAVGEALKDVYGAYAIAAYDQRNHHVHLLRNKERPLALVETPNAWYFASEGAMLFWILMRNGYTAEALQKIEQIPEHTLISFDLEKGTCVQEKLEVKKLMVTVVHTPTKVVTKTRTLTTTISKNEYKRIRKQMMGTKIEFWAEDYVEANFPSTYLDGETVFNVMGTYEDIDGDNIVHTKVDIAELGMKMEDLCDTKWYGTIYDMAFDTQSQQFSIYVTKAKPLPFSVTKKPPIVVDAEYIQRKLDEQERKKTVYSFH